MWKPQTGNPGSSHRTREPDGARAAVGPQIPEDGAGMERVDTRTSPNQLKTVAT